MRVRLAFPFASVSPSRIAAFRQVQKTMEEVYPWDSMKVHAVGGLKGDGKFNRGASRNRAVRQAALDSIDVLVLCDADTYPQARPLYQAIQAAYEAGGIHFPHNQVDYLSQNGRGQLRPTSAGGCWIFRPHVWADCGWMEERGGWSVDDRTFLEQMRTFGLGPHYHPGILTALWHAPDAGKGHVPPADEELIQRYLDARFNPEAMRRLINERGAP